MTSDTADANVLPALDRRSPFFVNVPSHEAKPIDHLIQYFKLWKRFVAALTGYLRDLVLAKEFELNLNLQLVESVQFPGCRDLADRCLKEAELQHSRTSSVMSSPKSLAQAKALQQNKPCAPKTRPAAPVPISTSEAPAVVAAMAAPKADVPIDPTYFPPDSLFVSMGSALINNHMNVRQAQINLCREVKRSLIPNLEQLQCNLGIKIKEIKSLLRNDSFANLGLLKEMSKTGMFIKDYVNAVRTYSDPVPVVGKRADADRALSLGDPFMLKLVLDHQLKSQLIVENYIFALYVNLQSISKDLLNYVVKNLNVVVQKLIRLTGAEAAYATSVDKCLINLGVTLKNKLHTLSRDWEYFMVHSKNFLNVYYDTPDLPKRETRLFKDVVYPFAKSVHGKCLRCGYLYRKQKLMKSYVSYFYVLTCNYLHEFKTDVSSDKKSPKAGALHAKAKTKGKIGGVVDHESTPSRSFNLNDFTIDVKEATELKFTLHGVSAGQKVSFKCQKDADFRSWTTDLTNLLLFGSNHLQRFQFIEEKFALGSVSSESSPRESVAVPGDMTPVRVSLDVTLNLKTLLSRRNSLSLLSRRNSLERIQAQSLNGAPFPRARTPNEQVADTLDNYSEMSPYAFSGLEPVPTETVHAQNNLENHLQLQNEMETPQKFAAQVEEDLRLTVSRSSSEDSIASGLNRNNSLALFLAVANVDQIGRSHQTCESISSLPEVQNLDHSDK